ncbi:MAG: pilus assembly protein TadG-related protein [Hyphomicrobiaceae bacterium]
MSAIGLDRIRPTIGAVANDEKGSIAIVFAICSFVLVMVTGLAIDIGRVMHAERTITNALDAAALAAAKGMRVSGLSDDEVETVAQKYFQANMQGHGGTYADIQSISVNVSRANNSVAISVESEVPMIFANVGGISKISLPKSSVAIFENKSIEIGLQLDVTGSMCQPCSKIAALKDAVVGDNGLLDILMPDNGTTNSVRIGLAPFDAGVNAGQYAAAVTGGRAGSDHCTYERRDSSLQATDTAPIGNARFKARSELSGASACPGAGNEVVAMTDDKAALRTAVNGLSTGSSTAGHLGAAWAWGLVSPEWATIWGGTAPAAYGDGRTEKYVILMTDGIYNTVGGVNKGDNSSTATQSKSFAQATCTAMKGKGVIVYTIGFQTPSTVKTELRACASGASKFYDAADADALKAAFRAIAEEINSLRLSS